MKITVPSLLDGSTVVWVLVSECFPIRPKLPVVAVRYSVSTLTTRGEDCSDLHEGPDPSSLSRTRTADEKCPYHTSLLVELT